MSSMCAFCLRAMRHQVRQKLQSHPSQTTSRRTTPIASTTTTQRRHLTSSNQLKVDELSTQSKEPQSPLPEASSNPSSATPKNLASRLRQSPVLKQTTEPYIAYGTTSTLLAECSKQIDYTIPGALANPKQQAPQNSAGEDVGEGTGWWYTTKSQGGLGLEVTFASWAQVMFLYMYCLTARLRAFPEKHAKIWHQQLLDHFFYAAEDRMAVWHNISARGARNKYLKDLSQMWRGVLLSYDEGVIKGDAVLAGAVWRNVFKGDENADIEDIALVVALLRGQLKMLDGLSDADIGGGRVQFQDPAKFKVLVSRESAMMRKGFSNEEVGVSQAHAE